MSGLKIDFCVRVNTARSEGRVSLRGNKPLLVLRIPRGVSDTQREILIVKLGSLERGRTYHKPIHPDWVCFLIRFRFFYERRHRQP
ncbi:hypothetical protein Agabi119p4_11411 [Agaricus bisporus var. burnettii]|uniref:Uncharacterized protein n=1 Tax=Agaricus bisporus var. burnettii TaxID=192524 RepID=A0A8H7EUQ6_AGABI|nr:hypothetical protein Agabi119p4_11411 [Agaricus bisporus var. burnettii]